MKVSVYKNPQQQFGVVAVQKQLQLTNTNSQPTRLPPQNQLRPSVS